jgi:hypothetical protein
MIRMPVGPEIIAPARDQTERPEPGTTATPHAVVAWASLPPSASIIGEPWRPENVRRAAVPEREDVVENGRGDNGSSGRLARGSSHQKCTV